MWLNKQVSLYSSYLDNIGKPVTMDHILFSAFDIETIVELRRLNKEQENYSKKRTELKSKLKCYTPAALLETKAKDNVQEIERTGLMQLDFDAKDISEYDIEDLKHCVFSLPFIAFCGLSCSGDGFYALALIEESQRLAEYAEHCFNVLANYGIKADTSKGRKVQDLRYLSYDANMLVRENPEPLKIEKFITKKEIRVKRDYKNTEVSNEFIQRQLDKVKFVQQGQRFETVRSVAVTLGGYNNQDNLLLLEDIIYNNSAFAGETSAFIKEARECFNYGTTKPF
jgi:hypothetical protein